MSLFDALHGLVQRLLPDRGAYETAAPRIPFYSGLGDGAWFLHGLVRLMRPAVCVEIGSARGASACHIGLALRQMNHGKLFAIDPHTRTEWNDSNSIDTYEVMRENLRRFAVEDHVEIIRKYSSDAAAGWDRPIDMLFIDGDHSYEGVKKDWSLFTPHVTEFGVVVFHDTIWDLKPDPRWSRADMGVPRFVEELRQSGFPVVTFNQCCGLSVVQPVSGGIRLVP